MEAPFGYAASALVGSSLLQVMHPEEHVALLQTTQALLATASAAVAPTVAANSGERESLRDSLRVCHRVLMMARTGHVAVAIDSTITVLQGQTTPRLLVASRYAVPIDASGPSAGAFRVFPARVPTIHNSMIL